MGIADVSLNNEPRYRGRYTLITGGAGFVGCNLADRLLSNGHDVLIYDNLSRAGVRDNLEWLYVRHGERVKIEIADIRDRAALHSAVRHAGQVFHLAAQVAVTTSFDDPIADFATNAGGTLTLLEALRHLDDPPPLLFTSANRVYGSLEDLELEASGSRYQPRACELRRGIDESRRLDFHTPYGCSKGAADLYVLDYARHMGVPAAVFRMSSIYGPHQHGTEDQGWIAHFLARAIEDQPLTVYGDGKQVRDVLFVDDLLDAFLLAQRHMRDIAGHAFNIGGGFANTLSLVELLEMIGEMHGSIPQVSVSAWRLGDQKFYVSKTAQFRAATAWRPRIGVREGVGALYRWMMTLRRDGRLTSASSSEKSARRSDHGKHSSLWHEP